MKQQQAQKKKTVTFQGKPKMRMNPLGTAFALKSMVPWQPIAYITVGAVVGFIVYKKLSSRKKS